MDSARLRQPNMNIIKIIIVGAVQYFCCCCRPRGQQEDKSLPPTASPASYIFHNCITTHYADCSHSHVRDYNTET